MGAPKIVNQLSFERKDLGKADTLRYNVLTYVVEEQYDRALKCLEDFLKSDFEYPLIRERSVIFIDHARDLVHAIRAKRNFPGASSLTVAKQQELNEKYRKHFEELQHVLKKIEKIQTEQKIDDIRSTVWVVRALSYSVFGLLVLAFMLDISSGLAATTFVVVDDYMSSLAKIIFN